MIQGWNQQYKTYPDMLLMFKRVKDYNVKNYQALQASLTTFHTDFAELSKSVLFDNGQEGPKKSQFAIKLSDIRRAANLPFGKPETTVLKPEVSKPTPCDPLANSFHHIAQPITILQDEIDRAIHEISQYCKTYETKMKDLIEDVTQVLNSLEKAAKLRNDSYKAYQESAAAVTNAYQNKLPNLPELQAKFVHDQQIAAETHTNYNELTAQASLKMEGALSKFEDIEKERSDELSLIIKHINDGLREISQSDAHVEQAFADMKAQMQKSLDPHYIFDFSSIPDIRSNPQFQIIPTDTSLSANVNVSVLYQEDVKQGGTLMRVRKLPNQIGSQLHVKIDDVVVAFEQRDGEIRCKDINDCVGYLPIDILSPIEKN